MNTLSIGSSARIVGYARHDDFTERLREFGLTEGTTITLLRRAPMGGPIEVQYGHSQIVLRPNELAHLRVQKLV